MAARDWRPLVGVVLALAAAVVAPTGRAAAQGGDLPPSPVPVVPVVPAWPRPAPPPAPPMIGPPIAAPAVPAAPPGPPAPLTYVPAPPVAPVGPPADPGRDGWGPYGPPSAAEGFFAGAEFQWLKPVFRNHLTSDATLVAGGNLNVPSAKLPWAAEPVLEVGYRLADSAGYFALNYRFLNSDGNRTLDVNGTPSALRSRVALNSADLDYGTTPCEVFPRLDLGWRVGVRLTDVFYDTRLNNDALSQQISNHFFGAGPHGRLDVNYRINPVPGLSVFGRLDGAVLIGQIDQHYRQALTDIDGTIAAAAQQRRHTQAVPVFNTQVGLSYTPPSLPNLHLTTGYTFEYYWYLGQLGINPDGTFPTSRGELGTQGWFLRAQVDF